MIRSARNEDEGKLACMDGERAFGVGGAGTMIVLLLGEGEVRAMPSVVGVLLRGLHLARTLGLRPFYSVTSYQYHSTTIYWIPRTTERVSIGWFENGISMECVWVYRQHSEELVIRSYWPKVVASVMRRLGMRVLETEGQSER